MNLLGYTAAATALAYCAGFVAVTYDTIPWRSCVTFRLPFGIAVSVGKEWR